MTRYRIVIEIEVASHIKREQINGVAQRACDETVTIISNPVYLSTERVENTKDVLKS